MASSGRSVPFLMAMITAVVGAAMLVGGSCVATPANGPEECADQQPAAMINVAGVFRYSGGGTNLQTGVGFDLSGTVTFEQQGNRVRVSDSTYDFAGLHRFAGEVTELQGNRLVTQLIPINGDEDYRADVTFIFSEDGSSFCGEYTDTNLDTGKLGSFVGVRQ